jgi:aspartyl protease family protein
MSCAPLHAADIAVTALFNGKAMLVIDNGKPRMLSVGQVTSEGVKLLSANSESAVIEFAGKRETLLLGQGTRVASAAPQGGSGQVTLRAGRNGHFFATGLINGSTVRFIVDTGASTIALSTAEARRLGINYLSGLPTIGHTANGQVRGYRVKLDTVTLGDITLHNLDADILDGAGPPETLLGMSFLSRVQMMRDGDTLTLVRRF